MHFIDFNMDKAVTVDVLGVKTLRSKSKNLENITENPGKNTFASYFVQQNYNICSTRLVSWSTYTVFQKKTSTHIIGYKLRNSCPILIIFDIKKSSHNLTSQDSLVVHLT